LITLRSICSLRATQDGAEWSSSDSVPPKVWSPDEMDS